MSKILVVAAHPDDEVLGVGATIAKKVEAGDDAYALILGEGQTSRWEKRDLAKRDMVEDLHRDTLASAKIIGYKDIFFENIADNRFDSVDLLDIVKCLERHIGHVQPDVIYTHHPGDLNIDHQITYKAVLTATRPMGDYCVKDIFAFETVSSTEWSFGNKEGAFVPNVYEDISNYLEKKCSAMKEYRSELCEYPHPRSLRMLKATAERWGSVIGREYAEAFEAVRIIR